jgi:dTDP-4-amino-4,6-dideoxygalactose transaminase
MQDLQTLRFAGNFTQQEGISDEAIAMAVSVLRGGRLHRYNVENGEDSEVSLLEAEFARHMGVDYALACASGGYAMQLALRAWGVEPDEPVLTNAFTLSPVPGAIAAVGGRGVLVETTHDLVMDLDDFERKARVSRAGTARRAGRFAGCRYH